MERAESWAKVTCRTSVQLHSRVNEFRILRAYTGIKAMIFSSIPIGDFCEKQIERRIKRERKREIAEVHFHALRHRERLLDICTLSIWTLNFR